MERDQEIRRLTPFVMRATGCKRDVAIHFLCKIGPERREAVAFMKILEMLNRYSPRAKAGARHGRAKVYGLDAWSKPR